MNVADLIAYLKTKWLGRGWITVSTRLRDAIVGRVWKIYANAFEHSHSPVGIFSCGQHYPRRKLGPSRRATRLGPMAWDGEWGLTC